MKMPWFQIFNPTYSLINWWFDGQEQMWRCPSCLDMLVPDGKREFETMLEHVSDPNKETYPLREVKVCANPQCEVHQQEHFFADGGGVYCSTYRGNIPESAFGSRQWIQDRRMAFEKTKIYKALMYKASNIFCWFGLHVPHGRAFDDSMFCGTCLDELEHDLYRKHPLFSKAMSLEEQMKLPAWRRYINF